MASLAESRAMGACHPALGLARVLQLAGFHRQVSGIHIFVCLKNEEPFLLVWLKPSRKGVPYFETHPRMLL